MGLVFGKTIDELPSRHVGLLHDVYHRAIKDIKSAFNVSREVAENALKSWVQGRGSGVSDNSNRYDPDVILPSVLIISHLS